jgi:AcrR family transcriptional regulator
MKSKITRDERKDETRRLVLEAARRVYGREGIVATPVSAVAQEAGRAHGSVFVHFGTQVGLINAVVEDFGTRLAGRLHERAEGHAEIRQLLEAHLQGIGDDEAFYTRLVLEESLLPADARLSWVAAQSTVSFHLLPALEAVVAADERKALSAAFLFNAWVGLVHHYLGHRDLFAPGGSVLAERGPELVDGFLEMIKA